ncbi:MAG: hypothetical protein D6798_08115 [Deltaproteobacteria bacterium]|nr:MAG: hypothetical protein D6798_08115 [Deltaproteobacteria bacterium]
MAVGMLSLGFGGIGVPGGPTATTFGTLGYDALPELSITGQGFVGLALMAVGIAILAVNNASAWKETGGY